MRPIIDIRAMGTNKEMIESLEAGLGGLQNNFSRMEIGVNNKLH